MKGEFLIQVNVAFGANSGLEPSQETFTCIVTFLPLISQDVFLLFHGKLLKDCSLSAEIKVNRVNIGLNHTHQHVK